MTELSNAVTVLIARMESHPEDFDLHSTKGYPKFGGTAHGLDSLMGIREDKHPAFWFLSDADKEALIAAWKKYHLKQFEKEVMEAIFDDGEGERELAKVNQQIYQAQQRAMIKNQMMQSTGTFGNGQITSISNPAQGMSIASNGAVTMSNTLSLGGETLDSSILKKLKDLVK